MHLREIRSSGDNEVRKVESAGEDVGEAGEECVVAGGCALVRVSSKN